ncbi:hypothetical protein [Bacillus sp. T3]|uniref:hypothetical protein n=1 Tax=Bacillus sp. T3 TaxID=467262 RepID=UPI002981D7A3|nr:hypothetical protein [Bacillus sp. T3]
MNPKKLFSIFIGILLLIVVYNFILPYFSIQTSNSMVMGMGMGMHGGGMGNNNYFYNYNLIPNLIIIISIVFLGFFIVNKLSHSSTPKCKKCNLPIESNEWKICPRCGNQLQDRGGTKS